MQPNWLRAGILVAASATASASLANDNVMVVFDGSNSMWGQINGTPKIEIARNVMGELLGDWADTRAVGLMAYGHRRRGDCSDIEVLVEPGNAARTAILEQVNGITPTGKTPLTTAVEQAAIGLSYEDTPATVVLISDGLESCERDPCALAEALERGGVDFTAHVVGFGLANDEDAASLACIAEETGGRYISAGNADELGAALAEVGTTVAQATPPPEPTPEPAPAPEPEAPRVVVQAPDTAVGGSQIVVTWAPTVAEGDYITVVPVGADPGTFGPYVRIGDKSEVRLPVPGDQGLYEARYVNNKSKETLGLDVIEVTEPMVTLTGPQSIQTGAEFSFGWTPTINPRDYVTIVPFGADVGTFGNYVAVNKNREAKLRAPAETGLYELRYVLNVDNRTVEALEIEVTPPSVTVDAPDTALTGAGFDVSWSGTVNPQDYITIVPMGADEGEYGNYFQVRNADKGELKAPAEPGFYEVRYVLREGAKTLASDTIEITAPSVTLSGPDTVVTGARFDVEWTVTVNPQDYVSIVPLGAKEGTYGNYIVVRDGGTGTLTAPADPGLYELRYILREGAKTMATRQIEVAQPEVTVSAPATAIAGGKFKVSWTGAVSPQDYINIVPVGTDEGTFGNYIVVRGDSENLLQAPPDTGLYEVRYLLREGARTVASTPIEITAPDVSISAPEEVRAGDMLPVTWTGTVAGNDYVNLVPLGTPDNEYGVYALVRDKGQLELKAPEETGLYEIRYLLREGPRVLARQTVEVLAADAPLNTGASLTAPDTASPGSTIEVGWTVQSDSADQRITLARADQAIFTWISAVKITGEPPVNLTVPDTPGVFEIRFLDLGQKAVLSRKVIKVE